MESKFINIGWVRLQYYQHGRGPEKLLLVHGYASSARMWQLMMERLDPRRFQAVAVNNRGAGESDRSPSEQAYTVESFANDLGHVVKALDWKRFTLAGHSMGGATAAQFALAKQDKLKALVLVNPAPLKGRPLREGWEDAIRREFHNGEQPYRDMGLDALGVPAEFAEAVLGDIRRNPIERALGGRRSMSQLILRERLKEIRVPTLVVGGDQDNTVGVESILAEYLALPPESRHLHFFHGIGHSPNVAAPDEMARLLANFVAEASHSDS